MGVVSDLGEKLLAKKIAIVGVHVILEAYSAPSRLFD